MTYIPVSDTNVPAQDSADNVDWGDVIGNKTDTTSGDSLVAINKQVKASTDNLPSDPADQSDVETAITNAHTTTDGKIDAISGNVDELIEPIGAEISNRSVTAVLFVSPNGDNSDGSSWSKAYTTIQGALDAASTDANECTLIVIGINTGANYYDINTAGDPTWTGNYVLLGTHRTWVKIKNDHASATSVMKFTGYASLINVNVNLGTSNNGVIMTKGAFRVRRCQFVGEDLTSAKTALHIDGATVLKHGMIEYNEFKGHTTYMTGLLLDTVASSNIHYNQIHDCLTGIQIVGAGSDENSFSHLDIGNCNNVNGIALDLDAGDRQHFNDITLHENTLNVDDEVGNHTWNNIKGEFNMDILPDDLTGVTVTADNVADTWGVDVEVRAAATSTKPFRIVGYHFEPSVTQKHKVRFTADNGTTYFDEIFVEMAKNSSVEAPSGTEHIFNVGTQIKASCKAETGGGDTIKIWLKVQEI